jgi:hypothetical protein
VILNQEIAHPVSRETLIANIKGAIEASDIELARSHLREAPKDPDAETLYLASLAALTHQQPLSFMDSVLDLDPTHQLAAKTLGRMRGLQVEATSPDEDTRQPCREVCSATL